MENLPVTAQALNHGSVMRVWSCRNAQHSIIMWNKGNSFGASYRELRE